MKLLLDSQVIYLWLRNSPRLASGVAARLETRRDHLVVSAASLWELAIKEAEGKLDLAPGQLDAILESDLEVLAITPEHGLAAARLPAHHGDPFDRILIAQARAEGTTLVGSDGVFAEYDVDVLWD